MINSTSQFICSSSYTHLPAIPSDSSLRKRGDQIEWHMKTFLLKPDTVIWIIGTAVTMNFRESFFYMKVKGMPE